MLILIRKFGLHLLLLLDVRIGLIWRWHWRGSVVTPVVPSLMLAVHALIDFCAWELTNGGDPSGELCQPPTPLTRYGLILAIARHFLLRA